MEEPARSRPPLSLLGATGGAGQDDRATDPTTGSRLVSPATATVAEGVHRWEKYSLLVRIFSGMHCDAPLDAPNRSQIHFGASR